MSNHTNIAETIAEITNIKSLEVYRNPSMLTQEARVTIDGHLIDLSTRLVEALAEEELVEIEIKVPARTFEAEAKKSAEIMAPIAPPAPPAKKEPGKRHAIADEIEAYMERSNLTVWKVAEEIGLAGQSVVNILEGKSQPYKSTVDKIRSAIKKTKKSAKPIPVASKGPIQFIQLKLVAWYGRERHTLKSAANALGVTETQFRSIQNGTMPDPDLLRRLATQIPDIQTNLGELLSQAKKAQ